MLSLLIPAPAMLLHLLGYSHTDFLFVSQNSWVITASGPLHLFMPLPGQSFLLPGQSFPAEAQEISNLVCLVLRLYCQGVGQCLVW